MAISTFLIRIAVAAVAVVGAAAPAFAATQNLSGTVTTTVPTNYTDDSATNAANATGASDGAFLTLSHSSGNHSSSVWTIAAGLSGWTGNNSVSLTFYTTGNMGTMTMTRIQFTDSSGNTATLSGQSLSLATAGSATISTNLSSYTIVNTSGTFSTSNVNAITFDFTVSASGNKTLGLDAVDVVTQIPEPSTIALFPVGLVALGFGLVRRRRLARGRAPPPATASRGSCSCSSSPGSARCPA